MASIIAVISLGVAAAVVPLAALHAEDAKMVDFTIAGDTVPDSLGGLKGDAARGRQIVIDRTKGNCLICHSAKTVDEPFQGKLGPALDGVGRKLTAGQIRLRLIDQSRINGKTLMPPYYRMNGLNNVAPEYEGHPALNAQQIEDVVAWLATLKD